MNTNNQDLSLSLYSYLCKTFGSEDVVRTRRRMFNALNSVSYENKIAFIISGSKAEGSDEPASDFDYLFVLKIFLVYDDIEDINNHKHNRHMTIPVIMDTNDTKPGYTLLKLCDRNHFTGNESLCCKIGNEIFLSSESLRLSYLDDSLFIIHGPCQSDRSGRFEFAISLQCEKWIMQAEEWMHRSRSSWPNNRLIDEILQYGVLFVPVGCKNSPRQDLEFRISFNVAEKILVQSFTHVQFLCYSLLKDILKHIIKPQYGDLVCSYFLKTIMFWVSEESIESIWKPHYLLRCFDVCFKRLVYCVTYNTCLHYFIPDLNLFEDRFSISEHDSLTCTLQSLYTNICSIFQLTIQSLSSKNVPSMSALPSLDMAGLDTLFSDSWRVPLLRLLRSLLSPLSLPGKEMYALNLSRGIQRAVHDLPITESYHITNKQRYRSYQNCLNYLLQGLHHDAVSGWLLLASFLYTRKQYQQCLFVVNYCLHKCTPDKILLETLIDPNLQHEFNIEMQRWEKNGFQRTCKRRVVDFVTFAEHSLIIPVELSQEVASTVCSFPPVVFAHFLSCLSLHHLNRNIDKINALRDLETTVKEKYLITYNGNGLELSCKCIQIARELLAK